MSRKPKRQRHRRRPIKWAQHRAPVYAPPGTITTDPRSSKSEIRVIAYGPDAFVDQRIHSPQQIQQFLGSFPVTWVNIDGLGDIKTIIAIGEIFGIHRLALEDVVHVRQRPKVEEYEGHLFIVARMLDRIEERLDTDQLSMFLGDKFVLTFQLRPGDCLDAVRLHLKEKRGRLRDAGPDFLAYAILDAVIDAHFPELEAIGDRLEELEEHVLLAPQASIATQVHQIKRELLLLRRGMWPLREAINGLYRGTNPLISTETRLYLRDCYDHTIQALDLIEVYRELCTGLVEMYMTSVSYRMNEIMKVLTIIATIFIPLTFVVGIYGMNFRFMPELDVRWGYPVVLMVMAVMAGGMLLYFWRKGWLSGPADSTGIPAAEESQPGERQKESETGRW